MWFIVWSWLCSALCVCDQQTYLTPPVFNIVNSKHIAAASNCGESVSKHELYCTLNGEIRSLKSPFINVFGDNSICGHCLAKDYKLSHSSKSGLEYEKMTITIDFGQEFEVTNVYIRMGNSPRPEIWVLELSTNYDRTFIPWKYFAINKEICIKQFGPEITCDTQFSDIWKSKDREIHLSFTNGTPNNDFYLHSKNPERTIATEIRLSFHKPQIKKEETEMNFYTINEISVNGRCVCNGHADQCRINPKSKSQKHFCDCKHNTTGVNCGKCQSKFYRSKVMTVKDTNACEPCNCDETISTGLCDEGSGRCHCKKGFLPPQCDRCRFGYCGYPKCQKCEIKELPTKCAENNYGFPDCKPCNCNNQTSFNKCDIHTGQCLCRQNFAGKLCDKCQIGFYRYPNCTTCDCDRSGTTEEVCSALSGKCICNRAFGGISCNRCDIGYYNYPQCRSCNCDTSGSDGFKCDEFGRCECKPNFSGKKCADCHENYENYPLCEPCTLWCLIKRLAFTVFKKIQSVFNYFLT